LLYWQAVARLLYDAFGAFAMKDVAQTTELISNQQHLAVISIAFCQSFALMLKSKK
jgi:hypothetical protein